MKRYLNILKRYATPITVVIICIYALYSRFLYRLQHEYWVDEVVQVRAVQQSFVQLLHWVTKQEFCSYLSGDYYLIYPFAKMFGDNKWGLAIPHIIATIVGFYILYLICKSYFKTFWAYLITFGIMCFNATLIEHAFEIRVYAVLPTLALAVLYLSLQILNQNNMKLWKKILIGIFFVLVIWFHAYGILIIASQVGFAILSKQIDKQLAAALKDTVKFMAIVFIVAMPLWLISVFGPHCSYVAMADIFEFIPYPLKDTVGFLKGVFGNLVGYNKFYFLLIGVILPFFVPKKIRLQQITFLSVAIFFPIAMLLLSDIKNKYWFLQRQFIWVMPHFAFFLGWSWDSVFNYILPRLNLLKRRS